MLKVFGDWCIFLTRLFLIILWIFEVQGGGGQLGGECDEKNVVPQLSLQYKVKENGQSVTIITCTLPCGQNFVPKITMIPCSSAQQCDNDAVCLDKDYREKNPEFFCKGVMEGSPLLEYESFGLTAIVKCRDSVHLQISKTDYILKSDFVPGRPVNREVLFQDCLVSDLISLTHLPDFVHGTPDRIFQNGIPLFYSDKEEKMVAGASRFFFPGRCDWILRYENGSRVFLYKETTGNVMYTQETMKFQVRPFMTSVLCSVKWYNSTERAERAYNFKVIDPLHATSKPKIMVESSNDTKIQLKFHNNQKLSCKFYGGYGTVRWYSRSGHGDFRNGSKESYRNVVLINEGITTVILETVKEVMYRKTLYTPDHLEDIVTCVIENKFGSDQHSIFLSISNNDLVSQHFDEEPLPHLKSGRPTLHQNLMVTMMMVLFFILCSKTTSIIFDLTFV